MSRLLLKDFLLLKKNLFLLISCIIVIITFGAASVYVPESGSDRTFLMQNLFYMWSVLYGVFIGLIIPMAHEKLLNTNIMLKSTSMGMFNIVASKYIFGMIVFVFVTVVGKFAGVVYMSTIGRGYDISLMLSDIKYVFVINLIIMIFFITANFCLDRKQMGYFQVLMYMFIIVGPAVILTKINALSTEKARVITGYIVNNGKLVEFIIGGILLAMVALSITISTKVGRYVEN